MIEDGKQADGGAGNLVISFTSANALDFDEDGVLNTADNCPNDFNPDQKDTDGDTEGDACDLNDDNDNFVDTLDVDDDGDGLIDIYTARQLDNIRNNLNGTALDASNNDGNDYAGGDSTGCGNGGGITTCNGYELMNNLDLDVLLPSDAAPGSPNWESIGGHCFNGGCAQGGNEQRNIFAAIFEGNNYNITNMRIRIPVRLVINTNSATQGSGYGFFGAITAPAIIRNTHIRDAVITNGAPIAPDYVGGLVGVIYKKGRVESSSVTASLISGGHTGVGGLVGGLSTDFFTDRAAFGTITSSYALVDLIIASAAAGGLLGGYESPFGVAYTGGLVSIIYSSFAVVGELRSDSDSGGLLGNGEKAIMTSSYAVVGNLSVLTNNDEPITAGGLAGIGRDGDIINSYAVVNQSIVGIGGLVGGASSSQTLRSVTKSYWDLTILTPPDIRLPHNFPVAKAGMGLSTSALQTPVNFTGTDNIYANWANTWCDPTTGEFTTDSNSALAIDANRVWDLGTANEYPAINCFATFSPAAQRAAARRALRGESLLSP